MNNPIHAIQDKQIVHFPIQTIAAKRIHAMISTLIFQSGLMTSVQFPSDPSLHKTFLYSHLTNGTINGTNKASRLRDDC